TAARVALPVLVADIALPAADTKADPAWRMLELSRRRGRRATGQARRRRIIRRPGVRRQSLISFSSRQGQS
ncbi:hypothetical protein, partial [Bordetella pertussis]|uniref:hypothetical protein n=1 Tax=Bordetella pertussis TaxID=520 RepID=UPI0021CB1633